MGVYTGGGEQGVRSLPSEFDRRPAAIRTRASDYHAGHARANSRVNDRVTIGVKAVVRQVATYIDQFHVYVFRSSVQTHCNGFFVAFACTRQPLPYNRAHAFEMERLLAIDAV